MIHVVRVLLLSLHVIYYVINNFIHWLTIKASHLRSIHIIKGSVLTVWSSIHSLILYIVLEY